MSQYLGKSHITSTVFLSFHSLKQQQKTIDFELKFKSLYII